MYQHDQYWVVGNPIAHSKSPFIHRLFAEQTQQNLRYQAQLIDTEEGEFARVIDQFRADGGLGLNITVPFKQIAWAYATQRSARADKAGAVNTLWFEGDEIHGDNTDGIGLCNDLFNNHHIQLQGKRILILGAGGAVRGILQPLLETKPKHCVIANRTVSKAQALVELFADQAQLTACNYDALQEQSFDLIINGTSASLQGQLPPLPNGLIAPNGWVYDMMYSATDTKFIHWAKSHGATVALDGLGMLVEQAAESFTIWRGIRPQTAPVIEALRAYLLSPVTAVNNKSDSVHQAQTPAVEHGGPKGLEPTRYGDWEKAGRCIDF